MKFSLFTNYGSLNSVPVWQSVRTGLESLGHQVVENDLNCDVPVIWSLLWHGRMIKNKLIWDQFRNQNKDVLVIEVGGIKRNTTWKVGVNGINRLANFGPKGNDDSRVNQLGIQLRPWRMQGDHILICLQHDKSEQWKHMPTLENYVLETVKKIRQYSNRKIIVRSHPRCLLPAQLRLDNVVYEMPKQIENTYDDFDLNFNNAWAVVSWSSNPGIHAVMNGIPAFVGEQSIAYDVANHDFSTIEMPNMPDRTQWLNDYANTEWTTEEIAQGIPFSRLTF